MKKAKTTNTIKQKSKISDFFNKVPRETLNNGVDDIKRKLSDLTQSNDSTVLNSVINLPQKCSPKLSPSSKKLKYDENFIPSEDDTVFTASHHKVATLYVDGGSNNFKVVTPEKNMKPSSSMKTPTPKKTPRSGNSTSKSRTPQSSRKCTPKKLFEKSPRKVEEFNVQILENFIKISPSTSNKKIVMKSTPEKNQNIFASPKTLPRRSPAQKLNENTPIKSPGLSDSATPKFKTKLNFSDKNSFLPSSNQANMLEPDLSNGIKLEFDSFLDTEFENIEFEEPDDLNLDEPQRCKILEVNSCNGNVSLKLKCHKNGTCGSCRIEEFWASSNYFKKGDHVNIQAVRNPKNEWVVNNNSGWLIYEPDLLIPCTTVVGSLYCKRKAVLEDRFRGFDPGNRIMIIGVLAHKLLQQALKLNLKTVDEIESLLKTLIQSKDTVRTLYDSNLSQHEIESELRVFIPKLITFIDEYIDRKSLTQGRPEVWQGKICGIEDIEENLWCPDLGLKGKIDVTTMTETGTMPLELKTGRATVSMEHRGQVVLYIMMMNKLGYQVSSGLLLYLREGVLKEIKATPQEIRDVMILRNELAYFLLKKAEGADSTEKLRPPELPEPLHNNRSCPKCPYNVLCTSYLKFENHDISKNKTIQDVQKNATSHLTQAHLDYFLRWSSMLSMEAESQQSMKPIKHIYTTAPKKRETLGKCIINLKIKYVEGNQNGLYEHTFEKDNPESNNLASHDIAENNYVIVSTNSRPAVASGFVTDISSSQVRILLDRNLNVKYEGQIFHLDSYDSNITFTFNMTSLALLLENTPRSAELRNIIIDKVPPTFVSKLPAIVGRKGAAILKRLNCVQQKAVLKALCAKQFLLIEGMPGTGKSATIVALIQLLVELDKSVLITSHTHSAVDNICSRLQKRGVDFIRLGSGSKIAANVKENSEATLTEKCTTPEQINEVYNRYKVIAVTCLGSGHPLLSKRTVDVCIVDESTQVLQTSVIKSLHAATTFVLIGDPNQLAPVIKNRDALKYGMSETLFERLQTPKDTIALNLNYRMNRTITNLANILTYEGQLQTANDEVANRTLNIPKMEIIKSSYPEHTWLLKAMETSLEAAVQLIDTGPTWQLPQDVKWVFKSTKSMDSCNVQNLINIYEVAIVVTLVKALIKGGVPSNDIGVIATYRAQVLQISKFLEEYNVNVSTVDQFQGSDKNVIIYSCTKSTDASTVSSESRKFELLEDKRRLTVAITRAKRKLLIVGDVCTLQKYKTFSIILPELMKNCIKFDLPPSFINNF